MERATKGDTLSQLNEAVTQKAPKAFAPLLENEVAPRKYTLSPSRQFFSSNVFLAVWSSRVEEVGEGVFPIGRSSVYLGAYSMDVARYYLDGNADVVEFCPHYPFHHILAAATYTLEEGVQPNRSGSISLFNVDDTLGMGLLHNLKTAGVFDMKWSPAGANVHPLLAQADSDGCLKIHSLHSSSDTSEHGGVTLEDLGTEKVSSSMCLCLDWEPSATCVSVGASDGSISIITFRESQTQISQQWQAHEFELWTTSFDAHQPHLFYTGSDDCKFSCWDLRASPKMVFQDKRTHKMGVCCITKSPSDSNKLLTGSYDEQLRIWDVRSPNKPINENSISLGGGVWRIKHHPFMPNVVLAACMHNGFVVVDVSSGNIGVLETYKKHESLAYGADWQRGELVATCSFYDKLVRIWKPESLGRVMK
ncbi:hypothetical protein H6P81_009804 [Aristolochia fimbriata]|uniref:methylated diphthine methylhydrolase n=1 Tax=Aristolochia fimbriata TaxID=158543 RepID=A0AAV7EMI6_ARIFI|nr:hypothetical protein H6P81_009804 [Aristolochia fimbriata]